MAKANQTEAEYFAIVGTGRKGVEDMLDKMWGDLIEIASPTIRKDGDTWRKRALVYIVNNQSLAEVLQTRQGIYSIYKCLTTAMTLGINFGGQFPHAHIVPYRDGDSGAKTASLIVTADGMRHAAKYGPVPVIREIRWGVVRENDQEILVDPVCGTVRHIYDPRSQRGNISGVWGIVEPIEGHAAALWMGYDEIIKIRDTHSTYYKRFKAGPWRDDEEMMCVKTAVKRFLRPYAAEAEGLAMAYLDDDEREIETTPGNDTVRPPMRDVTDRVSARLDAATATMEQPEVKPDEPHEQGSGLPHTTGTVEGDKQAGLDIF